MGLDVLKKLKSEAKVRQSQVDRQPAPAPKYEPAHRFFVSGNWKSLLEKRPTIAPKAAAKRQSLPDGGAADTVVALDCEMVGVGPGGTRSALARVSIVDHEGRVLIDKLVRPDEPITDYRSHITGITASTLEGHGVLKEDVARRRAADIMDGKIVVGHAVQHDFQALLLTHPHVLIRDTAIFKPLRPAGREKKTPSLARLAEYWLHESIRKAGTHDSVEDARIALRLYRLKSRLWEKSLRSAMQPGLASSAAGSTAFDPEDDDLGESIDRGSDAGGVAPARRHTRSGQGAGEAAGSQPHKGAPVASKGDMTKKKKKKKLPTTEGQEGGTVAEGPKKTSNPGKKKRKRLMREEANKADAGKPRKISRPAF